MLETCDLGHARHGHDLLTAVTQRFAPGRLHAVIGPNGAGKSTLLRLLAREWPATHGEVRLDNRPLADWPAAELARRRALLPQQHGLAFAFSATEVVTLGRLHARRRTPAAERAIVTAALETAGAAHLATRRYPELSGGERARVQLARVLAQIWDEADGPRYLLLDEPTAHLDLTFQHACLRLARAWAARGVGVIAVLHDPNLVLAYADEVSVLRGGRLFAHGEPRTILDPALMREVYGLAMRRIDGGDGQHWLAVVRD